MDSIIIAKPAAGTYPDYYDNYLIQVEADKPFAEVMGNAIQDSLNFWNEVQEEESSFRYAEGKWSIKEMLQHIIDTERVFVFRAMSFMRGEQSQLPGFDHNEYVEQSMADERTWGSLLQEYQTLKQSTFDFFTNLNEKQWKASGITGAGPMSVSALAYVVCGHDLHHQNIVKVRYLNELRKG